MDRDRAKAFIRGLFDESADDIDTERLESMRRRVSDRMRTARYKGLFQKVIDALDTEIAARGGTAGSGTADSDVDKQPQAEHQGELRQGMPREAGMKWRVTGR